MLVESSLKRSLLASVGFHGVVVVAAYVTLPNLQSELLSNDRVIVVEMVDIAEITNAPPPAPEPEPEPEAKAEPEPPPPAPEPTPTPKPEVAEPVPDPVPDPAPPIPEPEVAALPPRPEPETVPEVEPEPKPEPTPEAKPEPKPKPEVKPAPEPEPQFKVAKALAEAKPVRKPKPPSPPDPFASVLKTLEELKVQPPAPEQETEAPDPKVAKEPSFEDQIAEALKVTSTKPTDTSQPISISVIEAVAQQLRKCWIVPAGVENARDLAIEIRVHMNPDATVNNAEILNVDRVLTDQTYRAAAESALRATKNPRCQPLPLPLDRYQQWRTMKINFNPRDML